MTHYSGLDAHSKTRSIGIKTQNNLRELRGEKLLKASGIKLGLLLNFGTAKVQINRKVNGF